MAKTQAFAILASIPATLLSSCMTPFSTTSRAIDWGAPPRVGTITVSDPKMYCREALIDERRKDVEWIDSLMDGSTPLSSGDSARDRNCHCHFGSAWAEVRSKLGVILQAIR